MKDNGNSSCEEYGEISSFLLGFFLGEFSPKADSRILEFAVNSSDILKQLQFLPFFFF